MASVSSCNTAFSLELYRALGQTNTGNILISPFSISAALAMVYLGARGETATQMAKALSFHLAKDVHADFQTLNAVINSPAASYILKLANRLYGEETFHFLSDYLESTHKFYHADMKGVNFLGAAEECRAQINGWVEQQTEDKIKDLLQPGTVSRKTKLALINAIYFKGNWLIPFYQTETREMPFKPNQNESKPVQMMHKENRFPFNYVPDYNLQIVELPYVDEELSMFVLLPEEAADGSDPLGKLERELTVDKLDKWTRRENMDKHTWISVHLPKFKLEEEYHLKEPLASLGMENVFTEGLADLSGMDGTEELILSAVVHKAFVEVNEKGTEAAAAVSTRVSIATRGYFPKHFMADHPFLFFIRHNKTESVLFLGRFASP